MKLVYGIKVKSNFQMVLSKIRQMEKSNQKISTIGIGFGNRPIADNQNSYQYKLGSAAGFFRSTVPKKRENFFLFVPVSKQPKYLEILF